MDPPSFVSSLIPRPQHLMLRRQASSALDTHRWRALDAVVRLSGYALGAEAHARAFAAAYSALSTANQEAMVPLLACLRLLLAHAVRSSCLPGTLRALGKLPREGAPRSDMLAALAGMLCRACWAALMDCRGGTAAAALTAAFLDTALAPELFDCLWRLRRDLYARCPNGAPGALASSVAWLLLPQSCALTVQALLVWMPSHNASAGMACLATGSRAHAKHAAELCERARCALHGQGGPLHWAIEQLWGLAERSPTAAALTALHLTSLWLRHPREALSYQDTWQRLLLYSCAEAAPVGHQPGLQVLL